MIKVFWLEPVPGLVDVSLRRYYRTEYQDGKRLPGGECPLVPGEWSYHNKIIHIDRRQELVQTEHPDNYRLRTLEVSGDNWPHEDPRWPTHCDCGYQFVENDYWQKFIDPLYQTADGRIYSLRTAPVGAMWDSAWLPDFYKGPDGIALTVRTPGGDWIVDAEASNCTDPAKIHSGADVRTHYCWLRSSANPDDITVGKEGGKTCNAGAGSILIGSYHGFLRNGYLTDAVELQPAECGNE